MEDSKSHPIYKKGPKGDPANYRPVSLTSVPCKILESLVKDNIMKHLQENHLIRDTQHGFISGRSCTTNLVSFMEKLTKLTDRGKAADVIYLDFAKAFDKVPRERLLAKLSAKGIQGKLLNWLNAWLSQRTQTVVVNMQESTVSLVESGVPKGQYWAHACLLYSLMTWMTRWLGSWTTYSKSQTTPRG